MNAALALQDPVLVIEHVDLYGTADRVPEGDLDYILPPGTAGDPPHRARTSPSSATSRWSRHSLEAIEQTGIDAELIDLRWLDRASIDWDTIGESHQEDQRGADRRAGRARHLVRRLARRRDPAPVLRLARPADPARHRRRGVSPSISKVLERAAIAAHRGGRRRPRAGAPRDGGGR